jgi:hemolysin III
MSDEPVAEKSSIAPPKLRGWFHLGATPAVIIASLVLFILSKESLKFAVALYSITAIILVSVSAIYHRVPWSPAKKKMWRRWDHANINLLIAGSYTPFAVALLEPRDRNMLLAIVWTGALFGVAIRVFWLGAPRWLYVIAYVSLGWAAVIYLPQFWQKGGVAVFLLIIAGGLCYTAGGVIYGMKKPNFSINWFGFHELFHALTAAAFIFHFVAAVLVIYTHQ